MVQISDITLPGDAGLSARLITPDQPQKIAVLNGATGVAQGYYEPFARWLAQEHAIACLTYDYRDFGASQHGPLRASRATMADWGIHDQQTARDWLSDQYPDLPLWVIGHSLGGFMLGYQSGLDRIDKVIGVCSGEVHVREHPWPYKAKALSFWWGHGAALVALMGYLPGRASGLGADVPGPVFRQWRKWCTTDGFTAADPSLPPRDISALRAPVRLVSLSDDEIGPPSCVARLAAHMGPRATHVTLRPADVGLNRVGHIGVFARRSAAIWPRLLA